MSYALSTYVVTSLYLYVYGGNYNYLLKYVRFSVTYTQYGPIKNGCIKNQHSDFEKN